MGMTQTSPAAQCTGTEGIAESAARAQGLIPEGWHLYGRRYCTTCWNAVLPNANGKLRKHKAINALPR